MTTFLTLAPRDPVVARDGRPFGLNQGRRMRTLPWPMPSAAAGLVRSAVGKFDPRGFIREPGPEKQEQIAALLRVEVAGPLPVSDGKLFLPCPADLWNTADGPFALRPDPAAGADCDLPPGLVPACPPAAADGHKFRLPPAWWSADRLAAWLSSPADPPAGFFADPVGFRHSPAVDERTHVAIDPATSAATDGLLFMTAGLVVDSLRPPTDPAKPPDPTTWNLPPDAALVVRVRGELPAGLAGPAPLGGERRLVDVVPGGDGSLWGCPDAVRRALAGAAHVRMTLASPAIFGRGWLPGWLDDLAGTPPGCNVRLRLVSAAVGRWQPVSGWSYETGKPKPVRRAVPAGGTYFFAVEGGDPATLDKRWLEPVSDGEQDRRDGFGLATWGVWSGGSN